MKNKTQDLILTLCLLIPGSYGFGAGNSSGQTFNTRPPNTSITDSEMAIKARSLGSSPNLPFGNNGNNDLQFNNKTPMLPQGRGAFLSGQIGTGGGNGVRLANGSVVPLDLYFALNLKEQSDTQIQQKFKGAYNYFLRQVGKIEKVLPSFANDLKDGISKLSWILSELDIDEPQCLNDIGAYKIESGGKQLIIACQDKNKEVKLNMKLVRKLKNPDFLGVIFLHEVFVSKMLASAINEQDYRKNERDLVEKINPYILSNSSLDGKRLYDYALQTGFVSSAVCSDYVIEAMPERKQACADDQKRRHEEIKLDKIADDALKEYYAFSQMFDSDKCESNKATINQDQDGGSKKITQLTELFIKAKDLVITRAFAKKKKAISVTDFLERRNLEDMHKLFLEKYENLQTAFESDPDKAQACFDKLMNK